MATSDFKTTASFDKASFLQQVKEALRALGLEIDLFEQKDGKIGVDFDTTKAKTSMGGFAKETETRMRDASGRFRKAGDELGDSMQRGANEGKQALGGFSDFAKNALTLAGVSGAVSSITGALSQVQQPFIDLDKQVKNIGTLGVQNFEEFTGLAVDLSKKVPDSAATIAEASYNAISAGITGTNEEIAAFVEVAGKAGVAGVSDTNTAVNALTSVMNAYKLKVSDAQEVSSTFFGGIKAGKTSFAEMSAGLANVVPAASAAGISFKEVSGLIATYTALGVPTAQATTQMRAAIIELQKPGKALADVMSGVEVEINGVKQTLNASNMGKVLKEQGLAKTLQDIEKAATAQGLSMTQVFSSSEAASAALLTTGENAEFANEKLAAVANDVENNAAGAAFDVAAEGAGVKAQIISNKIQAFFTSAFAAIGTDANAVLGAMTNFAPTLSALTGVAAIVPPGALGSLKNFIGLGKEGQTAMQGLAGGIKNIGGSLLKIGGPMILIFLLVSAFKKAYDESEEFRATIDSLFASLKAAFNGILTAIKPILDTVIKIVQDMVTSLVPVIQSIVAAVTPIITKLTQIIQGLFQQIAPIIQQLFSILGPIVGRIAGVIQKILESLTPVITIVLNLFGMLIGVAGRLVGTLFTALAPIIERLAGLFATLVEKVGGIVSVLVEALTPILQVVANFIAIIVDLFAEMISTVLTSLMPAIDLLVDILAFLVELLAAGLTETLQFLIPIIAEVAKFLVQILAGGIEFVIKIITGLISLVVKLATAIGKWLVGAIKDAVDWLKGAWNTIITAISKQIEKFSNTISSLVTWIKNAVSSFYEWAKGIPIVGGLIEKIGGTISWLVDKIKGAIDWLKNLFGASDEIDAKTREAGQAALDKVSDAVRTGQGKVGLSGGAAVTGRFTTSLFGGGNKPTEAKPEEAAPPPPAAGKDKKEKAKKDILQDVQDEVRKITGEEVIATIVDEFQQERTKLDTEKESALIEIDRKITEVTTGGETEYDNFEATLTELNRLRSKTDESYQRQAAELEEKIAAQRLKIIIDHQKEASEFAVAEFNNQISEIEGVDADSIRRRSEKRVEILEVEFRQKLNTTLAANDEFQKEFREAIVAGGDPTEVFERLVEEFKGTTPILRQLAREQQDEINAERRDSNREAKRAEISEIADTIKREKELRIQELRERLEDELEEVKGNEALEREAVRRFLKEKAAIEDEYLRSTNTAYSTALDVRQALSAAFFDFVDERQKESTEKAISEINKEEAALTKSLANREIALADYSEQLEALNDKKREQEEEANKTLIDRVNDGIKVAGIQVTKSFAEARKTAATESSKQFIDVLQRQEEKRRALVEEGKTEEEAAALASAEFQEEIAARRKQGLEDLATSAAGTFLNLIAEGENAGDALLVSIFDSLMSAVPAIVAQIFGTAIGTLGPILGPIAAGALTATFYGLISLAKSATIGAADGEVPIVGPGGPRSDNLLRRVSPGEAIIKQKAVRAGRNEELLSLMNKRAVALEDLPEFWDGIDIPSTDHLLAVPLGVGPDPEQMKALTQEVSKQTEAVTANQQKQTKKLDHMYERLSTIAERVNVRPGKGPGIDDWARRW